MGEFSANITAFCERTGLKGVQVVKKLAFDALKGVMLRSPVDTGRFRASWRVGVIECNLTVEPDRGGVADQNKGVPGQGVDTTVQEGKLSDLVWGQTVFISNNVEYGPSLENGTSKQAPAGVMAVTFAELVNGFQRALDSVK